MKIERILRPSPKSFFRNYVSNNRPVIITNALDHWPARKTWTPEWFRKHYGDRDVRVAYQESGSSSDPTNFIENIKYISMTLGEYIDVARKLENSQGQYYLSQFSILDSIPELKHDLEPLPYLTNFYHRNRAYKDLIWMGSAGSRSHLHFDINHNFYLMFAGSKKWTIFPESQFSELYLPSHLTRKNVSPIDIHNPNLSIYPRFANARPTEFILRSGDLLFLPGRWAHQVDTLEFSIAINHWWSTFGNSIRNFHKDIRLFTLDGLLHRKA